MNTGEELQYDIRDFIGVRRRHVPIRRVHSGTHLHQKTQRSAGADGHCAAADRPVQHSASSAALAQRLLGKLALGRADVSDRDRHDRGRTHVLPRRTQHRAVAAVIPARTARRAARHRLGLHRTRTLQSAPVRRDRAGRRIGVRHELPERPAQFQGNAERLRRPRLLLPVGPVDQVHDRRHHRSVALALRPDRGLLHQSPDRDRAAAVPVRTENPCAEFPAGDTVCGNLARQAAVSVPLLCDGRPGVRQRRHGKPRTDRNRADADPAAPRRPGYRTAEGAFGMGSPRRRHADDGRRDRPLLGRLTQPARQRPAAFTCARRRV